VVNEILENNDKVHKNLGFLGTNSDSFILVNLLRNQNNDAVLEQVRHQNILFKERRND